MVLKLTIPRVSLFAICSGDLVAESFSSMTETRASDSLPLGLELRLLVLYASPLECVKMVVAHNLPLFEWCLNRFILHEGFILGYLFAPFGEAHFILQSI